MNNRVKLGLCCLMSGILLLSGCGSQYTDEDYLALQEKYTALETDYDTVSADISTLQTQVDTYKDGILKAKTPLDTIEGTGSKEITVPDNAGLAQITCDSTITASYTDADGDTHKLLEISPAGSYSTIILNSTTLSLVTDGAWSLSFYNKTSTTTIASTDFTDSDDTDYFLGVNDIVTLGVGTHIVPISWYSLMSSDLEAATVKVNYSGSGVCSVQDVRVLATSDSVSDNSAGFTIVGGAVEQCYLDGSGLSEFSVSAYSVLVDLYLIVSVTEGTCTLALETVNLG